MSKPGTISYQYRYGAKHEIKEILQSAKRSRPERLPKNQEIYFEPVSIYYLCGELLEIAKVPENPHALLALQRKYEQMHTEKGGVCSFP